MKHNRRSKETAREILDSITHQLKDNLPDGHILTIRSNMAGNLAVAQIDTTDGHRIVRFPFGGETYRPTGEFCEFLTGVLSGLWLKPADLQERHSWGSTDPIGF